MFRFPTDEEDTLDKYQTGRHGCLLSVLRFDKEGSVYGAFFIISGIQ